MGKAGVPVYAMMPERLATTDPFTAVTEMVGSGPFRYVADERLPGALNVYAKFDGYVPRPGGPAAWTAGPKAVHFDQVEWACIPDPATASAALINGEAMWQEYAYADQLPVLKRGRHVTVQVNDRTGFVNTMRLNELQPPFNNPVIRRALWAAIDQNECMQAIVGTDDRDQWLAAPDLAAQQAVCRDIQVQAFADVPYYPLGASLQPTAYRSDAITGLSEGFATFWNVRPV